MAGKKNLRKKLYVSGKIQGRMLAKLTLYWGVYHFVLFHAMFMYRYMQYRADILGGAAHVPFAELYSTFAAQHYSMVLCALGVFPIVFWDMVKITHRVAGPLVRFQNTLRDMANGGPAKPIKLRKGDMLVELESAFNEYVASLEAQAPVAAPTEHTQEERDERRALDELEEIRNTLQGSCCDEQVDQTAAEPLGATGR